MPDGIWEERENKKYSLALATRPYSACFLDPPFRSIRMYTFLL